MSLKPAFKIRTALNNTNTNNIIINVYNNEIPDIISFNKDWDISHLNIDKKLHLFISTVKYTSTLESILKNDKNLNVLINDNLESGYVLNDNKIEIMSVSDIIDLSIIKIYKYLKNFSNEILEDTSHDEINKIFFENHLKLTENKLKEFNDNKEVKKNVEKVISSVFNKFTEKTKDNFIKIIKNDTDSDNNQDFIKF